MQNHQASSGTSHQAVICHLEPHLNFPRPILYSQHSHFLPIKLALGEVGASNAYRPIFDVFKLQDFILHSILTMYPMKYHEATVRILRRSHSLLLSYSLTLSSMELSLPLCNAHP
jgi:hypothetical protein